MKVKELIEDLQNRYNPEAELIVAYWDRETVEGFLGEGGTLSEETWNSFVGSYDEDNYSWSSSAAESFVEVLERELDEHIWEGQK